MHPNILRTFLEAASDFTLLAGQRIKGFKSCFVVQKKKSEGLKDQAGNHK